MSCINVNVSIDKSKSGKLKVGGKVLDNDHLMHPGLDLSMKTLMNKKEGNKKTPISGSQLYL